MVVTWVVVVGVQINLEWHGTAVIDGGAVIDAAVVVTWRAARRAVAGDRNNGRFTSWW